MNTPRKLRTLAIAALFAAGGASATDSTVITQVRDACGAEITAYCSKITPGEGRLIACLYANEGSLSGRCELVIFDAAANLARISAGMNEVARICKPDIELLCNSMQPGQGGLAQCLRTNQKALSAPCADAFEKAGIDVQ